MYWKNQLIGLVILIGLVQVASIYAQDKSADRKNDEDEIYAVVIRSQMEQWIRDGDKGETEAQSPSDKAIAKRLNVMVFFVSINGEDPSDEFMRRFDDLPRTIRKASSEVPDKGPHTPVDKSTGKAGIVFNVEKLRWRTKDLVEVEGGYYCGGLCAAGITFSVRRENGKWKIKSSHMNWIS